MQNKSLEGYISSILLLIVFFVILLQVFIRIFPLFNVVWTEELSRWLWVWMVCMCWGELERVDQHLRLDFIHRKMPNKMRVISSIITNLIYLAVVINLFFIGIHQVLNTLNSLAVTLPTNRYFLYLSVPIGLILVLYRLILKLIYDFQRIKKNSV